MNNKRSILVLLILAASFALHAQSIDWRPIVNGVLKIDERPAKIWEIYVSEKDKRRVLLQLGSRFLLIDTEGEEVSEIAPEAFERRKDALRWTPPTDNAKKNVLPSEEWSQKHAGRARIIRLRLSKEGRRIEIQLPVTPDLRKFY